MAEVLSGVLVETPPRAMFAVGTALMVGVGLACLVCAIESR
jgi:hypothetical protein